MNQRVGHIKESLSLSQSLFGVFSTLYVDHIRGPWLWQHSLKFHDLLLSCWAPNQNHYLIFSSRVFHLPVFSFWQKSGQLSSLHQQLLLFTILPGQKGKREHACCLATTPHILSFHSMNVSSLYMPTAAYCKWMFWLSPLHSRDYLSVLLVWMLQCGERDSGKRQSEGSKIWLSGWREKESKGRIAAYTYISHR